MTKLQGKLNQQQSLTGSIGAIGKPGLSAYEIAVANGFEGTEKEWLESLRYDHSDEFTALANQVKQDAQSSAENAANAEQAMTEANETAKSNIAAIQQASEQAQEDIASAKTTSVNAVVQAQQTAEQSIVTKHSEAVQAIESAQSTAETAIDAKQAESVQAVETAKEEATSEITTAKTGALNDIETAKNDAIEEIENTGVPLEDIEKLAIKETAQGNPTIISDSAEWRLQSLNVYGQSSQDGTPSPENPVDIISKEVSEIKFNSKNMFNTLLLKGNIRCDVKVYDNLVEMEVLQEGTYRQADVLDIPMHWFHSDNFKLFFKGNVSQNSNVENVPMLAVRFNNGDETIFTANIVINQSRDVNISKNSYDNVEIVLCVNQSNTANVGDILVLENLTLSTEDIPYEPYKEQTVQLSQPITLRGLAIESGGNVTIDGKQYISDVICEKDGVIGVERNIAEVKKPKGTHFDFSKVINSSSTERFFAYYELFGAGIFNTSTEVKDKNAQVFSNFAKAQVWAIVPLSGKWTFDLIGGGIRVNPPLEEFNDMTAEQMNTIFSSIDTVFIGLIGTPTFEPLPEDVQSQIKALKTYYPNTVIDCGAYNKVKYIVDSKLYIDNKFSELNQVQADMLEIKAKI